MERPLTALFIDCDSYFASVEQHLDPALRGRPVGVAPVMAETSCCIAASYEAKAFGVKTGTRISDARVRCPGIAIVEAKPPEYLRFHHRVVEAVEDCIHVEAVLSIDEMWAWLPYNLRDPATVEAIGKKIKATVARDVSPVIKVSIGAGPNKYLAKIASKMRKPDGLFIIEHSQLPDILHPLKLRDLTGVGRSMEARLHSAGIRTVEGLCDATKPALHKAWGGVLGERLWHLLRGDEIPDLVSTRKSLGHSHVLPPDSRTPDRAWPVLCKLLHKACERLRAEHLLTGSLTLQLGFVRGPSWSADAPTVETDATLILMHLLERLWHDRPEPGSLILKVGVVLTRLCEQGNHTPQLFQDAGDAGADATAGTAAAAGTTLDPEKHQRLDVALDKLRARYGRKVIYYGSVQESRDAAPMRISFTHIPDAGLEGD
ncbi:MAG: DNA polymerase [Verrucomicrobia bacterium]|nr:DNA polymerase [Verrucomicrobiota bacterium]